MTIHTASYMIGEVFTSFNNFFNGIFFVIAWGSDFLPLQDEVYKAAIINEQMAANAMNFLIIVCCFGLLNTVEQQKINNFQKKIKIE